MSKANISIGIWNCDKSGLDVRNVYISKTCHATICGDKIDATIDSIQKMQLETCPSWVKGGVSFSRSQ